MTDRGRVENEGREAEGRKRKEGIYCDRDRVECEGERRRRGGERKKEWRKRKRRSPGETNRVEQWNSGPAGDWGLRPGGSRDNDMTILFAGPSVL